MISRYDVIRAFKMAEKKGEKLAMYLSEDEKSLMDTETGEYVCSIETYIDYIIRNNMEDFKKIGFIDFAFFVYGVYNKSFHFFTPFEDC